MSEYYESSYLPTVKIDGNYLPSSKPYAPKYNAEGSCKRCMRSSPIASLIGVLFVLFGGAAFGGGYVYGRKYILEFSEVQSPKYDWDVYAFVGPIAIFTAITYIICALSTGYNARNCFDTSKKSCCGRCCNMFLICCLVFGLLLWIACACVITYTLISVAMLTKRHIETNNGNFDMNNVLDKGKTSESVSNGSIDLSYFGLQGQIESSKFDIMKEKLVLVLSSSIVGIFMMLFGYIIILICVAMNYARLQEARYYEADDCEESMNLRS